LCHVCAGCSACFSLFFFQAEDGIRDFHVTGVQTCALPISFTGGSLIVGPDGGVLARGPEEGEALLEATLDPEEVRRARTPYAHARDDDPRLTMRLLQRVVEGT